ncbi:MAG: NYN domain-containing protein [Candidatus Rokubacteria bacterium]|nr:NYN domain-containing protein [Candidatus Rokubacteria bacterium]MBI2155471.1 NYN domain-containing protein [Candidatus Rokubacteria bacterium]MBI4254528.1 NYN domain-containing protein [Candidatus Rokubacteria bacterium]MBI4628950.1 NYN domain-containing protein [Candidatus Rokubacteria bacterium]
MRWLIDGYNVIRRDPDLRAREAESLEAGRRALLALVAGAARASGDSFTVVFDGAPGPARAAAGGQVEVVFSRPPRTADDVLMELARRAGSGAALVSGDRRVQDAARRAGCAAVDAEAFVAALDAGAGAGDDRDDDDEEPGRAKRGNPRRLSKDARAAARALRRLRSP